MATIKYRDENGNLVTVGAGLHTHSPSDIGAATEGHGHDVATDKAAGFLSAIDKAALDATIVTVNKLDNWIGDKAVQDQISEAVDTRVEKVTGKGLSTNDYTTAEKTKLANIEQYANNYELPTASKDVLGGVKTTSTVTNSSGYTACPIVSGVPYYKNTNTQNTAGSSNTSNKIYLVGTTSQTTSATTYSHDTVYVDTDGCLYSDSTKVSTEGHTHPVDAALSSTSTNPVQNKVVYAIDQKVGETPVSEQINGAITAASTVIKSAANTYTDNKISALINGAPPTLDTLGEIVTALNNHSEAMASTSAAGHMSAGDKTKLDGLANYTHPTYTSKLSGLYKIAVDNTGHISGTTAVVKDDITALGVPSSDTVYTHPANHPASMITGLATVATSGSYNDLSNKPTIPEAYTHPTTAGNKHIPSGGSSGQVLGWSSSGTATWTTPRFLPSVTTSNNGQFLRVVNGAWTAVTIKTAESEAL